MKINRKNIYLIFATFYIYFIMALFESSRGNFIPFFIEEFKTNNSTISMILSLNTVGCVIGSFLGGSMCEKFGHKFVFLCGTVIATAAVFMAPFISNIYMLTLFYFVFGIGRSALSVSVDSLVPVLSVGFEVILMNITHFMYGFGSFAGQSICGKLLYYGFSWRSIYAYLGIFFVLSIVFSAFMKIPNMHVIRKKTDLSKSDLYKDPLIPLFVTAVAFYILSESLINTWFINYIRSTYNFNPAEASLYASMFFLFFAAGRLLGGFIINKLGDVKGLKLFIIMATLCVLTGLLLKKSGLILISLSGFFISIGFPTFMVIISKSFNQNSSMAIGLITTLSNIMFVVMFYFVGVINDHASTYAAFFIAPLSLASCFVMLSLISAKIKNQNSN